MREVIFEVTEAPEGGYDARALGRVPSCLAPSVRDSRDPDVTLGSLITRRLGAWLGGLGLRARVRRTGGACIREPGIRALSLPGPAPAVPPPCRIG